MRREKISTNYSILIFEELSEIQLKVIYGARKAVKTAYSPYSEFQVGASILMNNGEIVLGNNQENAVYPLGLCAERVALFSMGVSYPKDLPILMGLTIASENKPGFPCGSCRQAMIEFEQRYNCNIPLLIESKNDEFLLFDSAKDLLPFAFNKDNIE